jgi:hypothetical protein
MERSTSGCDVVSCTFICFLSLYYFRLSIYIIFRLSLVEFYSSDMYVDIRLYTNEHRVGARGLWVYHSRSMDLSLDIQK